MKKTHVRKTRSTKTSRTPKTGQKPSQQFLKVYLPYIPLFLLVFLGLTFGMGWKGTPGSLTSHSVLAYSTEMSTSELLAATNAQRAQNGSLVALKLNTKLASAAQTKANDMVARDYWSHNTPDGKEPWTFIDATGYEYLKAGENLAYGFDNSDDTVIGWMNSPSHRANILDTSYREVGFGFVNGASYVGSGQETIVVAMYGNPAEAPTTTVTTSAGAPAITRSVFKGTATAAAAAQPITTVEDTVKPVDITPTGGSKLPTDRINQPITSDTAVPASQPSTRITRLQTLTSGYAPWSAAALSGVVVIATGLWALKHALIAKRVLLDGEQFLLHHPVIDVGVLSIVAIGILLSQSSGVVK